ncbi:MAG: selenocysteine-specific translation elongation factor [Candidatus Marinimicrobia bacterium]|nr:selenocysteine-specific translation elongation factor [Candidatus Neomarinimicrobiota bacterium]
MRPIIIGTAGHIDHGKSTLIRALTGTDPDRLKEEKQRGMTIDIGFAFLTKNIAFIDVPGHERFIKNMVTGASTVDTGLLVIAADDGIMPQTREHLDILSLLNISRGLIVITKIDTADAEWIDLVEEELRELVKGTFLQNAPVFRVSSVKGTGIAELKDYFLKLPEHVIDSKTDPELFRLPVDRVFVSKGYGTVVTGSVISGQVSVGDELEILPLQKPVKVRGIQSHNKSVDNISTGHRAAINIQGIERRQIERGFVLATRGYFKPSKLITCSVSALPSAPDLVYNARVRVHIGTGEYLARIRLIGKDKLLPGESAIAQLVFDSEIPAGFQDRFIIRQYSPMITIGGGSVLEVQSAPLRKKDIQVAQSLAALNNANPLTVVRWQLESSPTEVLTEHTLAMRLSCHDDIIQKHLDELKREDAAVQIENAWYTTKIHNNLKLEFLKLIRQYHRHKPLSPGPVKTEIFGTVNISPVLGNYLLKQLSDKQRIKITGDRIAMADFTVDFSEAQQRFINRLDETLQNSAFNPPDLKKINQSSNLPEKDIQMIIACLLDQKRIVQIDKDKFLHSEVVEKGMSLIRKYLINKNRATVSELKEVLQTSRKWAIPILNYYDRIGLTVRLNNMRMLS